MSDATVGRAVDLLMRLAVGERAARAELLGESEENDALLAGLNMLAEELEHEEEKRLHAEQLLQDVRDAYDRSPGLLCSVDAETLVVVKCNHTLAEALGVGPEALLGRPVTELFADEDRAAADRMFRVAARGDVGDPPELLLTGGGARLRVNSALSLSSDRPARVRVVWRDVTRERQLEQQLVQAQKMQAVGRLSGGVAHDFNNILAVILTSVALVRRGLPDGLTLLDDLQLIEDAARRGAGLTAQLLAFSRQQVVSPRMVEVGAHLRELERMLRRLISEDIDLSLYVADDDLVAFIDPAQLTQVVVNLVVNARDAARDKSRITLEASRVVLDDAYAGAHLDVQPGEYVLLSVSDNGHGMPKEVLAQVFEPFFTTKPVGEGSGLGLSVCYGIARQAGGHIYVYSEVDRGTTVKVYIPRRSAPAGPAAVFTGLAPVGTETVLLVEDDNVLRLLTTRLLERAGYRVLPCVNGAEALEKVTALGAPVDLVLTDVVMPRMGGRELVERLLAEKLAYAALYVSGYTANAIVHHGVLEDGVQFLAKPFTPDQLLRAVRDAIGGRPKPR